MTWLRCSDRNWFFHGEIPRAGMENEQILDGLCQDNGIIRIENGRGQFSHNHVFCLTFSSVTLSRSLYGALSASHILSHLLCVMHTNTHPHMFPFSALRYYYFLRIPNVAMWNGTCIESSLQLGELFSCRGTALHIKSEGMNKEVSWEQHSRPRPAHTYVHTQVPKISLSSYMPTPGFVHLQGCCKMKPLFATEME